MTFIAAINITTGCSIGIAFLNKAMRLVHAGTARESRDVTFVNILMYLLCNPAEHSSISLQKPEVGNS